MNVGIFQPDGEMIADSVRDTRKAARRDFARVHGIPWGWLWALGYRVRHIRRVR